MNNITLLSIVFLFSSVGIGASQDERAQAKSMVENFGQYFQILARSLQKRVCQPTGSQVPQSYVIAPSIMPFETEGLKIKIEDKGGELSSLLDDQTIYMALEKQNGETYLSASHHLTDVVGPDIEVLAKFVHLRGTTQWGNKIDTDSEEWRSSIREYNEFLRYSYNKKLARPPEYSPTRNRDLACAALAGAAGAAAIAGGIFYAWSNGATA